MTGRLIVRPIDASIAPHAYWQTLENNVAGRALYDNLAHHHGFIVYSHDA